MGQYSLINLLELNIQRPPVVIDGFICERQNAVFAGAYGTGKTMFWLQASLCLVTGQEFLGKRVLRPYRTAFLDYENDIGDIKERLQRQIEGLGLDAKQVGENFIYYNGSDPDDSLHVLRLDSVAFENSETAKALDEFIEKNQPEILIFDNLGLVCGGELKEPEDVKNLRRNLKALRARHECLQGGAIVLLHHLTKPQNSAGSTSLLHSPREFLSQTRGTGRLLDYMEARFGLSYEPISADRRAYIVNGINRSAEPRPLIMEFDTESLLFRMSDDDKLRLEVMFAQSPKKRAVLAALAGLAREFSYTEAETMINPETGERFNNKTVSDTLQALRGSGFLQKRTDDGMWVKSPKLAA